MANKYCNLKGYNKVSDEYGLINTGFDKVDQDVSELQTEVKEIVKGDANAEVGQAHVSTAKGKVFETIKDRFEEIEEDVSVNLMTAQLSLSTADSIKSVTANVGSVPKVRITAPDMLVNLLGKDGDFENVTIGYSSGDWLTGGAGARIIDTKSVFGKKCLIFDGASFVYSNKRFGSGYYIISAYVFANTENSVLLSFRHADNTNSKSINNGATVNVWKRLGIAHVVTDESYVRISGSLNDCVDGVNIYKISQAEYDAVQAGTITVDQLLAKYPYVNGAQPLLNPCLTVRGKNLFDGTKVIKGKLVSSVGNIIDNVDFAISDFIKVKPNMVLTKSGLSEGSTVRQIMFYDENKNFISSSSNPSVTIPQNIRYIRQNMLIVNINTLMIEEGTVATPHEEYREKQRIYPCTLGKVSTYADELTDDGIKAVKTWRVKKYVLQASNISSLNTGEANVDYVLLTSEFFKKIGGNITLPTESKAIVGDYIGVVYSTGTWNALINPHHFSISGVDGRMAFIFPKGTYANLAAAQAALTGTEIWYVLAQEEQEIIEPVGSLRLEQGYNCIDVSTGIVYEKANPILAGGNYAINKISEAASILKYKTNNILALLKNKIPDNNWIIGANSVNYYGGGYAYIPEAKYDLTATYTVLYEVLHEEYNSQQVSVIMEYADNLRTSHNQLVENVAGLESEVNDVWFSLLPIADKEIAMQKIALLTTETTADLKAKVNEILNVWR